MKEDNSFLDIAFNSVHNNSIIWLHRDLVGTNHKVSNNCLDSEIAPGCLAIKLS